MIYTPEGPKAIADFLRVSRSLSSINLSDNNIGSEGAKVLVPALRDSHSLTQVCSLCEVSGWELGI